MAFGQWQYEVMAVIGFHMIAASGMATERLNLCIGNSHAIYKSELINTIQFDPGRSIQKSDEFLKCRLCFEQHVLPGY